MHKLDESGFIDRAYAAQGDHAEVRKQLIEKEPVKGPTAAPCIEETTNPYLRRCQFID